MGIFKLWKYLEIHHSNACGVVTPGRKSSSSEQQRTIPKDIDNVLVDTTQLLFFCTSHEVNDVVNHVIETLKRNILQWRPRKSVFFALEGLGPRAKLPLQQVRRSKKPKRRDKVAMFTLGSQHMKEIQQNLFCKLKQLNSTPEFSHLSFVYSGGEVSQEGEVKIIHYMQSLPVEEKCLILSSDSDMVVMGLLNGWLDPKERLPDKYNKDDYQNDRKFDIAFAIDGSNFMLVRMNELKRSLAKLRFGVDQIYYVSDILERTISQTLADFCFLFIITGTDYSPKLNNCSCLPHLLASYIACTKNSNEFLVKSPNGVDYQVNIKLLQRVLTYKSDTVYNLLTVPPSFCSQYVSNIDIQLHHPYHCLRKITQYFLPHNCFKVDFRRNADVYSSLKQTCVIYLRKNNENPWIEVASVTSTSNKVAMLKASEQALSSNSALWKLLKQHPTPPKIVDKLHSEIGSCDFSQTILTSFFTSGTRVHSSYLDRKSLSLSKEASINLSESYLQCLCWVTQYFLGKSQSLDYYYPFSVIPSIDDILLLKEGQGNIHLKVGEKKSTNIVQHFLSAVPCNMIRKFIDKDNITVVDKIPVPESNYYYSFIDSDNYIRKFVDPYFKEVVGFNDSIGTPYPVTSAKSISETIRSYSTYTENTSLAILPSLYHRISCKKLHFLNCSYSHLDSVVYNSSSRRRKNGNWPQQYQHRCGVPNVSYFPSVNWLCTLKRKLPVRYGGIVNFFVRKWSIYGNCIKKNKK